MSRLFKCQIVDFSNWSIAGYLPPVTTAILDAERIAAVIPTPILSNRLVCKYAKVILINKEYVIANCTVDEFWNLMEAAKPKE